MCKSEIINSYLKVAIEAAIFAGYEIMKAYKENLSPLTTDDKKVNDVINKYLKGTYMPIIREENDKVIQDLKEVKSNKGFPDNIITKKLNQLSIFNNIESAIYGSNCTGVLTEWDEFKQYDWELTKQKNIPVFKHMIS